MSSVNIKNGGGCESDLSFTWEDFFGSTTTTEDLVPTLLGMYDALVGSTPSVQPPPRIRPQCKPPPPPTPVVSRPLSISSIASSSSSSSSSVTSSCSGGGVGRRGTKSAAYLASIESLDDSDGDKRPINVQRLKVPSNTSQGSGDSGVHSPCSFISSPSPPHTRPRYCDPHLSYMDRVVIEIIETEAVYVADLRQVIVGYKERWQCNPNCPITSKQMADLFSNIEDIYLFNSSFLCDLEKCGLDPVKLAQCFVENNDGFSIYTEYCTNYPRTVSVLTELMRQEATVKLFRERQLSLHHTLPLGSYLLKPVQRILKYHLLLQNIVKQSSETKNGYSVIVNALSTMTAIAQHINNMKRKHEHAVRVQEIQSLLLSWEGEDLTTFGELCAEGTFRMTGAKALRHAFLFDKMLLITKRKEEGILGYKAHIMCSNLMLIESVPGEPLSFHVIPFDNPRLQYTLHARNLEQKREWTLQLKRVILENYNAVIPSHARQLVMQLGQNRTDDEILADRSTPKKQHSAPEYLEKRKQERERRKSETGLKARLRCRTRSSDSSICNKAQQRLRRNCQNREKKENLPPKNVSERFSSPVRRKSEPSCSVYSVKQNNKTDSGTESVITSVTELRISESDLSTVVDKEHDGPAEKKRTLEEIVGQLLMQNREFKRILKKQRSSGCRRQIADTSDEEDDYSSYEHSRSRSCGSVKDQESSGEYDNLQNVWKTVQLLEQRNYILKRTQSFTIQNYESSPEHSLPCSLSHLSLDNGPTSPAVWLKQQHQHLATQPTKKSGSLPRSFQLNHAPEWPKMCSERPITIASDKPQELNLEDMERYMDREKDSCQTWRYKFPVLGDTTEEESIPEYIASSQHLNVHPEYKIYKRGLTKTALKLIITSVSNKLAGLRSSSEMLSESESERRSWTVGPFGKQKQKDDDDDCLPTYKQGSSSLGARIAHGSETSDYADPRVLFPSITPSKKAASLLGIRPYSVLSLISNLTSSSDGDKTSGYSGSTILTTQDSIKKGEESDGSADSFYERSFEAMESVMDGDVYRDSAVFSDPEDMFDIITKIPVMKTKIPPPIPAKPANLKTICRLNNNNYMTQDVDECDSSSVASTVVESTLNKGWVKHVIGKLQGDSAQ
uniref:DH domain-containing protein n=1 Tax=Clastoptera arizonana TaxID=38151 RepID=A0A1B6BYK0_9HEMI